MRWLDGVPGETHAGFGACIARSAQDAERFGEDSVVAMLACYGAMDDRHDAWIAVSDEAEEGSGRWAR